MFDEVAPRASVGRRCVVLTLYLFEKKIPIYLGYRVLSEDEDCNTLAVRSCDTLMDVECFHNTVLLEAGRMTDYIDSLVPLNELFDSN